MIAIVDYGMGNPVSVLNMLRRIGADAEVTADPHAIRRAARLIIPGVGAFDSAMRALRARGLAQLLDDIARNGSVPLLGICLGMQLMTGGSEEGDEPGFGWVPGFSRALPKSVEHPVPHMGWNTARAIRPCPLLENLDADSRFYFVHSYYVECGSSGDVVLETRHGRTFTSGFARGRLYGVQFHPEKSHRFGMQLLAGFARST